MNYLNIVRLITDILVYAIGALVAYLVVFGVVGLFKKKKFPKTDKINRYGIVIPTRNEEKVVAALIESIQKNDYPQGQLQIFVVAHNCTDRTAEIARACGATVYEYNDSAKCTKGYALNYLFSCIQRDYGVNSFRGFFLFDADNVLTKNFISKMNDAFEYFGQRSVIVSYRNSKNFGKNLIAGFYGMYFAAACRLGSRGRTVLDCSTRITGTGYLFPAEIVKNGWNYVTLTEDLEFTADRILYDDKIYYCDEAEFFDEQPTSVKIMWRQRVRWSRGQLLIFFLRFREMFAGMFKKNTKHRGSLYDIAATILPLPMMMLGIQIIRFGLEMLAPVVDKSITYQRLFLGTTTHFLWSDGILFNWARAALFSLPMLMFVSIVMFIAEHRRIRNVSLIRKILIVLLFPLFMFIQVFIDLQALFSKNLGWKPIPHKDQTNFDSVNSGGKKQLIKK